MAKTVFNMEILDDGSMVIESTDGSVKSKKTTSLGYFLETFGSMFNSIETPILPLNCRKIIKSSTNELYIFEYPSAYRRITYDDDHYENVLCPRTIFIVKLAVDGAGAKTLVKANFFIPDNISPFSLDMPLHTWIFNNFKEGTICWGTNESTARKLLTNDPSTYAGLFNVYIGSKFNDHWPQQVNTAAFIKDTPDAIGRPHMLKIILGLQNKQVFPDSALTKTPITLRQIIVDYNSGKF